tara:strand:+ start:1462 stop:2424 length:963 start_codon:yes stop_codon:yes gene_type:complete
VNKKIALGTWSWGNKFFWNYKIDDDEKLYETFSEALKRGFSLIDTADSYGTGKLSGKSEELIGRFLKRISSSRRDKIKIATKLAPYPWRIGRKGFNVPFERSYKRLNKQLDIVQLHWSTAKYNPWQDYQLLNNLCNLIDDGYEFDLGLSNIGPERLDKIINFLNKRGKKLKSVQVQFSLLCPNLDKQKKVQDICIANNIDFMAYSPLSFGLLCKEKDDFKSKNQTFARNLIFKLYEESSYELREVIKHIADSRSVSLAQVAINWCCYQGAIPIVGLRKKSQVIDIAKVLKWNLNLQEFKMLEEASKNCSKKLPANPFSSN